MNNGNGKLSLSNEGRNEISLLFDKHKFVLTYGCILNIIHNV